MNENKNDPLEAAIRQKIADMITGPMTVGSVRKVALFSAQASKLLGVLARGPEEPAVKKPSGLGLFNQDEFLAALNGHPDEGLEEGNYPGPPLLSNPVGIATGPAASSAETFASRVVRELLASWKSVEQEKSMRPTELVQAIADAETNGLHDVAKQLRDTLRSKYGTEPKGEAVLLRLNPNPTDDEVQGVLAKKKELVGEAGQEPSDLSMIANLLSSSDDLPF